MMTKLVAIIAVALSSLVATPQLAEAQNVSHSVQAQTLAARGDWLSRKLDRIASCESGRNPRAVSGSGKYRGAWQFSLRTWHSVGGHGDPIRHSYAAQKKYARKLYKRSGSAPWPVCGRR